ncbi:nitrile hydratase accessory protein [Teichococcus aerofrigidensis]
MSRCDDATAEALSLPRDAEGPVFAEPWEAQAFAMAVALHEAGCFGWGEWAEALGRRIAAGDGSYYAQWLDALEALLAEKGIVAPEALEARRQAWARAAAATPHGRPITLAADPLAAPLASPSASPAAGSRPPGPPSAGLLAG